MKNKIKCLELNAFSFLERSQVDKFILKNTFIQKHEFNITTMTYNTYNACMSGFQLVFSIFILYLNIFVLYYINPLPLK